MPDTLHLSPSTTTTTGQLPANFSSKQLNFTPNPLQRNLQFPTLSSSSAAAAAVNISISKPCLPSSINAHSDFQEKMLFLDSIGIDFLSLTSSHPHIAAAASVSDLKQIINYLTSIGLSTSDLNRIASMCPEILSLKLTHLQQVITFLQQEAGVEKTKLRHAIHRRPRLLISSVENRLQPTLNFLKTIGVSEINRHTSLLSCSVEEKFIPRIEYLQKIGFSYKETTLMIRRFPSLLRYSIEENLEPKLNYLVVEMGRELKELVVFPEYLSFSLENRIKARHRRCVEKGVVLSLQLMLKSNEETFVRLLEEIPCCNSSLLPVRNSHLLIA
ncbi:transcription termination factor MTEF1, chloroplastic-like [Impatiens glandulifera]|uniref:transcription termination factor MTEF1, chloroplastic-like n=1 Tax=Impatiens glandulifera TaxID=253017 RepID=UPI001FB188B7|nr:transcription termination factor MTEF1, chloroplastic-like [Impatiens glandulifera]